MGWIMDGVEVESRVVAAPNTLEVKSADIANLVSKYGGSASVALLDPKCKIFTVNGLNGVIGYRTVPGCAVVFGDPVCHPSELETLSRSFHNHCQGSSIVYVTASESFSNWALNTLCKSKIESEEELVINPQHDPTVGSDAHQLRKKLNRAKEAQIEILEYKGNDPSLEVGIKQVGINWLNSRKGPQIYMAAIDLFSDRIGKRWFYAKQGDCLVGMVLLHQLQAKEGWLIHMVMVPPNAPQGTSESLVVHVLKTLREEGCLFATFGATPKKQVGEVVGLSKLSTLVARKGFHLSKKFFDLDNRRDYWKKYKPQSERCFILFSRGKIGVKEVMGILRAFNVSL
jgi:lysylphosphatidylglycerol synthetase-like protein (DUF2156 family)